MTTPTNRSAALVLDTTLDAQIAVFLFYNSKISRRSVPAHRQSEKLLPLIRQLLTAHDLPLSNLKFIAVATGAGSYTSLKVGAAVANALGWSLDIPVISIPATDCHTAPTLKKVLLELTTTAHQATPAGCGGRCGMCGGCGAPAPTAIPKHFTGPLEPDYTDKADWEQ